MTHDSPARCPALLIAAPASGQGKTLVTAALARRHRAAGRRVRVFKCGPDFLDPMVHEVASGAPVHQLDLFMCGEAQCRALLHEAAQEADLILVEGVMGLYDGDPSAADLAQRFGLPVLAVVDGSSMAQTFGALVHGLATYRPGLDLHAVIANRVGSARHAQLLEASVPAGVRWLGALPREGAVSLPERHLGLVQAGEVADLDARLDRAAALLPEAALHLPPPVEFAAPSGAPQPGTGLAGKRIAIARDEAFAFIYRANLEWLERSGARLSFFSPLRDGALPACDALWLPGGYPELHLETLAANHAMLAAIRAHHGAGKPILAECGGMLYTCTALIDGQGRRGELLGLLPGEAAMQPRFTALGMQQVDLEGGTLRGHTFHYSRLETALEPVARARTPDGRQGEALYRAGSLTASYMHMYFPSAPDAAQRLFTA
ncbi:cobyrinate a,c-diamide synthase [Novosphingobium sp. P6W]|uniref:cobyrinate a,c-diamide synthase n=1 Tax=Novosphingobium sp. P6W TaxID=1609758 RepID=UPI0005C30B3B|nr:cobyrinate a,c-diamide synthase [Novosphingobium sp. P6W]AXB75113.1 cobyrinate a,c-diamide synthase [Novosphingobium sp. P6W]KIS32827.1 cobyrinic acid a,c-diamide synthase [Novosphingobium sp. P6W]